MANDYGCQNGGTFNMEHSFLGNGGGRYPDSIIKRMMKLHKLTWLCECAPGYIGTKCENEGIIYQCKFAVTICINKHEAWRLNSNLI